MSAQISALLERVLQSPRRHVRRVIAIAGPPASGKSTLAAGLVVALQQAGVTSQLVPMDGFHLDNSVLTDRGILDRKGSPPSFDAIGLLRLVQVLGAAQELYYPVFDRARDLSIAGAGHIAPDCDTIVIEGNYLLMDAPDRRVHQKVIAFDDNCITFTSNMPRARNREITGPIKNRII